MWPIRFEQPARALASVEVNAQQHKLLNRICGVLAKCLFIERSNQLNRSKANADVRQIQQTHFTAIIVLWVLYDAQWLDNAKSG